MTTSDEGLPPDSLGPLLLEMVGYALHSDDFSDAEFSAHYERVAEEIGPPHNQSGLLALLGMASVTATIVQKAAEWSDKSVDEVMQVLVRGIQTSEGDDE